MLASPVAELEYASRLRSTRTARGRADRRIHSGNAKPSASGSGQVPELETLGGRRAPQGPADSGL